MSAFKEQLLSNWDLLRIMRLGIGTMMLVMGIQSKDWAMGLFSVFFLYQAVTNTGCCGARGCAAPPSRNTNAAGDKDETITEYEEIK